MLNRLKLIILIVVVLPGLLSCTEVELQQVSRQVLAGMATGPTAELTLSEIEAGLREALRVGSERVVGQVGRADGFLGDAAIRIPLPPDLEKGRQIASRVGLERSFADLEERLNRAAEQAAPQAEELFLRAIREMSVDDVRQIFNGPDDAATRYFENRMSQQLAKAMRPVVDRSLEQVGAVRIFRQLLQQYNAIPFAPRIEADLSGYVVEKGMAGIFHYLAKEEAAIRKNPAKRTTEILRKVFS